MPSGPQRKFVHKFTVFYKYTVLYNIIHYFFKSELETLLTQKIAGGFAEIFFYRQNPPHPATVLCHCPDFKNNKSYFFPHPKTTLPAPRFFAQKVYTKKWVKDITVKYNKNAKSIIVYKMITEIFQLYQYEREKTMVDKYS